ncbi:minor tail protein [Mycobacterium phage Doug]|uniref:Minor tail protein n=1 Tax=Mycobacterium phage Doug TaxID=2592659 RepID=A0A5J6T3G5_9CAUD|nr:minor tail protein [Mycobacterium phage Doug]QFG04748.1 minor tail protein [Mycobacterium phage Doug]
MSVAVGWWAESHVSFGVTLTPEVGFHYGGPKREFGVTLTPEVGMAAVAHNRVGFGLSVPISLGMGAASHSKASFGLVFAPYIAMRGPSAFQPVFPSEDLYPSNSLFPTPRSQQPGFGLSFSPSFGFAAAPKYARSFSVEVTAGLGFSAEERYSNGFGIELSPQIGMSGAERYYREFGLELTPSIGMDGEGNNGVMAQYDAIGTGAGGFGSVSAFSFTAAAGADVFVVICHDRSGAFTGAVSYGGVAMNLVTSAAHNNSAGNGGVSVYRLAGAGSGSAKTVSVGSGSGWMIANAVSFTDVRPSVSASINTGSGSVASQSVTLSAPVGLQVFSGGNGGGPTTTFSGFTGVTNRYNVKQTGGILAINTVSTSGSVSASTNNPWAAVFIDL